MKKFENMVNYVNEVYQWWKNYEDDSMIRPVKTVTDTVYDEDGNSLKIEFSFLYGDEETHTGDEQLFKVDFLPQGDYVLTGDIANRLINEITSLRSNDWVAYQRGEGVVLLDIRPVNEIFQGIRHEITFMFRNDIVVADITTLHIEKMMYTKYDDKTWVEYLRKAQYAKEISLSSRKPILGKFELKLHDASKDPGLHSFWIWSSDVYDRPRCEDLAKEIRKHLAKSQLHQDFEKVETEVTVYPNDDNKECSAHITIWINASLPKPCFKFKHNLTNLDDLHSLEDYDRDSNGEKVEECPARMLLNAIRERDSKIAAEMARKQAEEEAEMARKQAEKEAELARLQYFENKKHENYKQFKNFVNEIGDFKLPYNGWTYLVRDLFKWNDEQCSYKCCFDPGWERPEPDCAWSFFVGTDSGELAIHKNDIFSRLLALGVREPQGCS